MIDRETLLSLIPHQHGMCLLDEVVDWGEDRLHARARSHLAADHPLRRNGALSGLHLAEYGAQAMAVHGGLLARRDGGKAPAGLLVALRGVELAVTHIDDVLEPLEVHAERLIASATGMQYAFRIEAAGRPLASGRAAVMFAAGAAA